MIQRDVLSSATKRVSTRTPHASFGGKKSPIASLKNENENRSEYALAGDVVNLAARLAAASEKEGNGVLCDETTLESLTGGVRFWLQTDRQTKTGRIVCCR